MKTNRLHFFKQITAGGIGFCFIPGLHAEGSISDKFEVLSKGTGRKQYFNMCGYRAPKLDIVRVGFIGIGNRGYSNLNQMTFLEGVQEDRFMRGYLCMPWSVASMWLLKYRL